MNHKGTEYTEERQEKKEDLNRENCH